MSNILSSSAGPNVFSTPRRHLCRRKKPAAAAALFLVFNVLVAVFLYFLVVEWDVISLPVCYHIRYYSQHLRTVVQYR